MYATHTSRRERAVAFLVASVLPAGMILAFLRLGNVDELPREVRDNPLITFIASDPPPPPPVVEPLPQPKPRMEEGKSAPPAKKAKAKEVVAPKPTLVETLAPVKAAPVKNTGNEAASGGAAAGPGTGAGGVGNGTGSGASGNGMGGGGMGAGVKIVRGITNRDYPRAVQVQWPAGGQIFTRLRIRADGSVKSCDVVRSFGNPTADMLTCSLLTKKGRFRPATDGAGRPIEAWFGYVQRDLGRFDR